MKLSKLYSNRPEFEPIAFREGLSVVYAEIRVPANRELDTHNLGKTTVGTLIDFCLLKGKSPSLFLYRHETRFADFTFYLELQLDDGTFLTIARPVNPGSKIDFLRTPESIERKNLPEAASWDHVAVAFDRAKKILDGILGFRVLQPWGFRMLAGYLIRSQADYQDVFQLRKFSGKHRDWKPFVAHLLGLEAEPVIDLYGKRDDLASITNRLQTLTDEWGGNEADPSVLDGLISVKRRDVESLAATLDSFNFEEEDRRVTTEIVEDVELSIKRLNEEKYQLTQLVQRLTESLHEDQIIFRPDEAADLFRQAGVLFSDQLKKSFEQLIEFNKAITQERRAALEEQAVNTRARLAAIDPELHEQNSIRARSLEFLRESESLAKYKDLGRDLAQVQAELNVLETRRDAATRLAELRREQRSAAEAYGHLQSSVEEQIEQMSRDETTRFGKLRQYFSEIIHDVLGHHAIIAIKMNSQGGLDFVAEFVGSSGAATSEDRGTSYKKLMCIAFDLAMLRAYTDVPFARFVYHDGALEQLEPRKRRNLIGVFRQYAAFGIQPIISALNSDLPDTLDSSDSALRRTEVVLTLHDEGEEGRLFKMPPW
ncbi:DUF2326 domain-containing protein [Sinomonas soli]